jgi:hypothetical protein
MIGRFRDAHRGLRVLDGLAEPAELGKHVGEPPDTADWMKADPKRSERRSPSSATTFRSNRAAASLNSPRALYVMPSQDVASTSIERSPRVRAMPRASWPNLTASS